MTGAYERSLRDKYYENDGTALRIPASGGGTDYDLPDVLGRPRKAGGIPIRSPGELGDGNFLHAHELKRTSEGDSVRFSVQEVLDLIHYAEDWGAWPMCTVFFPYTGGFHCATPVKEHIEDIPYKSFGIKKSDVENMTTLKGLMEAESLDDITRVSQL